MLQPVLGGNNIEEVEKQLVPKIETLFIFEFLLL